MESSLRDLIAKGKEQGFLPEIEIRDRLPKAIIDQEQIEDIFSMIEDMGIRVQRQNDK